MDKAPDAFRTISEFADELDVPQHVLRFWETRFPQIKPMKRGGGRRYYRPEDVDLLRGIRHLLYGEGYTIRGVQRLLKDNGAKFVQGIWKTDGAADADGSVPPLTSEVAQDASGAESEAAASDDEDDTAETEEVRREPTLNIPPRREVTVTLTRANPNAMPPAAAAPPASPDPAVSLPTVTPAGLSAEDKRRLDAALFELGECRRLLDMALKE